MKNNDLIMKGLYAPLSYWESSREEKENHINGCGPHHLPSWLIPDNLLGANITESCNIHDWMFKESKIEEDFKNTDQVFLKNMQREIPQNEGILRMLRNSLIYVYYGAVRVYSIFSRWNQKES